VCGACCQRCWWSVGRCRAADKASRETDVVFKWHLVGFFLLHISPANVYVHFYFCTFITNKKLNYLGNIECLLRLHTIKCFCSEAVIATKYFYWKTNIYWRAELYYSMITRHVPKVNIIQYYRELCDQINPRSE
jgi:hypothetical protein